MCCRHLLLPMCQQRLWPRRAVSPLLLPLPPPRYTGLIGWIRPTGTSTSPTKRGGHGCPSGLRRSDRGYEGRSDPKGPTGAFDHRGNRRPTQVAREARATRMRSTQGPDLHRSATSIGLRPLYCLFCAMRRDSRALWRFGPKGSGHVVLGWKTCIVKHGTLTPFTELFLQFLHFQISISPKCSNECGFYLRDCSKSYKWGV